MDIFIHKCMFSYVLLYSVYTWNSPLGHKYEGWKGTSPFYSCKNQWAVFCPSLHRQRDISRGLIRSMSSFIQTSPSFPPAKINKERKKKKQKGSLEGLDESEVSNELQTLISGSAVHAEPMAGGMVNCWRSGPRGSCLTIPSPNSTASGSSKEDHDKRPKIFTSSRLRTPLWPVLDAVSALDVQRSPPGSAQHAWCLKHPEPRDVPELHHAHLWCV